MRFFGCCLTVCLLPFAALAQDDPHETGEPEIPADFFANLDDSLVNEWPEGAVQLTEEQIAVIESALEEAAAEAKEDGTLDPRAYILVSSIWPVRTIPVCWEDARSNDNFRQIVREVVEATWQRYSSLTFTSWGQCSANTRGIRIEIADANPRVRRLGKGIDGLRNGMRLNATFQNYSPVCQSSQHYDTCVRGIAIHEFGHALGFAHEQNRPDTPGACDKPEQGSDGTSTYGLPWDDQSVMNYCNPRWWSQGRLSQYDAYVLQQIYGVP